MAETPGLAVPELQVTQAVPKAGTHLRRFAASALAGLLGRALLIGAFLDVDIGGAREWLWRRSNHGERLRLTKLTDNRKTERVAISPDGRYVVYARRDGDGLGLWVRQVATRSSDVEIVPPEVVDFAGLTFSPDGDYVYFVRSDKNDAGIHSLFVTPVLGGLARLLLKGVDSPVSFSPDGHRFVFTRGIPNQIDLLHIALRHLRRDLAAVAGTIVEVLTGRSGSHRFICSAIMPPAAAEVDPIAALPAAMPPSVMPNLP